MGHARRRVRRCAKWAPQGLGHARRGAKLLPRGKCGAIDAGETRNRPVASRDTRSLDTPHATRSQMRDLSCSSPRVCFSNDEIHPRGSPYIPSSHQYYASSRDLFDRFRGGPPTVCNQFTRPTPNTFPNFRTSFRSFPRQKVQPSPIKYQECVCYTVSMAGRVKIHPGSNKPPEG